MQSLVPYTRPRGAIHDLQHLLSLSSDRCIFLCLSEQELYVLHNWMALDLEFESRYALTLQYNGYEPLTKDSDLWGVWLSFVRGFQIGARDMSCNIEAGLTAVADAIQAMADRPCGGGGAYPPSGSAGQIAGCLTGIDNDQFLGPGQSEIEEGVPPAGFATWEEYQVYKCHAAEYIYRFLVSVWRVMEGSAGVELTVSILAPLIVGVAGVLPAAFTPAGFVAFITACLAFFAISAVGFYYVHQGREYIEANHQDIVCSLFNSGTSSEAIAAVANITEDAIQGIVFGGAAAAFAGPLKAALGTAWGAIEGNGLVEPLFKLVVTVETPGADCSGCGAGGQCNEVDTIGPGTGNISGTGTRTLTGTLVNPPDPWYEIRVYFTSNKCLKVSAYTGTPGNLGNDLCRLWFCNLSGVDVLTYSSDTMTPTYECADTLVVISATPFTMTLDIQGACDEDADCNP